MSSRMFASLAFAVALSGCVVAANDDTPTQVVVPDSGALVLDWTIDGSKNTDECDLSGSSTLDVTISTSSGVSAGEYQQACKAFATTITLAPGHYSAEAVLLDAAGRERTTAVQIRPFDILGNDQLSIPIEFPKGSFYAP